MSEIDALRIEVTKLREEINSLRAALARPERPNHIYKHAYFVSPTVAVPSPPWTVTCGDRS